MSTPHEHEILDWLELILRHCEGQLTPAEAEQMTELILHNDRLRWYYLEVMDVEATIALQARQAAQGASGSLVDIEAIVTAARPPSDDPQGAILQPAGTPRAGSLTSALARAIEWRHHPVRFWSSVSVLTLLFLATLLVWIAPWAEHRPPVASSSDGQSAEPVLVARVVDHVDVVEHSDSAPAFIGAHLQSGQTIRLAAGMAKIEFKSGATVLLKGPAQLRIIDSNAGHLAQGKLIARVETPAARGFAIETPRSLITDLGTEFGVEVRQKPGEDVPTTWVTVYQGVVENRLRQTDGRLGTAQRLIAGQTLAIKSTGQVAMARTARPARFTLPVSRERLAYDTTDTVANVDEGHAHAPGVGLFFQATEDITVTRLAMFLTTEQIAASDHLIVQLWDAQQGSERVLKTAEWNSEERGAYTRSHPATYRYDRRLENPVSLQAGREYAVVLYGTSQSAPYLNLGTGAASPPRLAGNGVLVHVRSRYVAGKENAEKENAMTPGVLPRTEEPVRVSNGIAYLGPTFFYQRTTTEEP